VWHWLNSLGKNAYPLYTNHTFKIKAQISGSMHPLTRFLLARHWLRDFCAPKQRPAELRDTGKTRYGSVLASFHHPRGVLVKYGFEADLKPYTGWSHYTGEAFRGALNVGNHIKIVYLMERPRVSRWVEDDCLASAGPLAGVQPPHAARAGNFQNWVNHFRHK
jgi:hypothetical protein